MNLVLLHAQGYNITKIPEIQRQLTILESVVDNYIFEQTNGKNKSTLDQARKNYIGLFNSLYLEKHEVKNQSVVAGDTIKMIEYMLDKLTSHKVSTEQYLTWFFNEFLENSPKMKPGSLKMTLSNEILNKYLYDTKDERKEAIVQEQKKTEEAYLIERAKKIFNLENIIDEDKKAIRLIMRKYKDSAYTSTQAHADLEILEKKYNDLPKKEIIVNANDHGSNSGENQ